MTQGENYEAHEKQVNGEKQNDVEKRCEEDLVELNMTKTMTCESENPGLNQNNRNKPQIVEKFDEPENENFDKSIKTDLSNGNQNHNLSRNEAPLSRNEAPLSQNEAPLSQNEAPLSQNKTPMSRNEAPLGPQKANLTSPERWKTLSRNEAPLKKSDLIEQVKELKELVSTLTEENSNLKLKTKELTTLNEDLTACIEQNKKTPVPKTNLEINNRHEKTMTISTDEASHAIGKNGRNVKEMENTHMVKITSKRNGTNCTMKITGSNEDVQSTYEEILRLLKSTKSKPTVVCRYFLGGKCWFGDKCKFRHPTSTAPNRPPEINTTKKPERNMNQTQYARTEIRHTPKDRNIFSYLE